MKKKFCLALVTIISLSVLADKAPTTAAAPKDPAPAPAVAAANSKPAAARRPEPRTIPLVPGPAVVSVSPSSRVMVRGQAKRASEIITRMTNGESVTVIEEINLTKTGPDEPSAWAKIVFPEKAAVWVNASYIDSNHIVKPKTLRLRSGPGENYSIIGSLKQGDPVKEIGVDGNWIKIEPPAGAYAFIAAQYLIQQTPVASAPEISMTPPSEPAPTTATITEPPAAAPAPTEPAPAEPMPAAPVEPPANEPPPPRIVDREGLVRGTISIQAPTKYSLISADNGRVINYLYTTSSNLDLSRYKGLHIVVTGEEGLDKRWKNTPIITIQRIQVIE